MTQPINIHIYSDGSYFEKQDIGGWGVVVFQQEEEIIRRSGWQKKSSSLEMELTAALQGLQQVAHDIKQPTQDRYLPKQITLFTDSRILIEGLSQKIKHWRQAHWIHKSGNAVKYQSLWEALDHLTQQHQVTWQWVKGHNGNLGNTLADQLARNAMVSIEHHS